MSDAESSDSGGTPFASQDNRDVFGNIRDRFGHLGKHDFCSEMVTAFGENDLSVFRQALYDLAVKTVDNTPVAKLVIRKGTQNSGGQAIEEKLAEDLYHIYHYIQGDNAVDITKLFPDKEKTRLRKESTRPRTTCDKGNGSKGEQRQDYSDNQANEMPTSMMEFCRSFLVEMRKDREILFGDIQQIKQDTSTIKELRQEIAEMKGSVIVLTNKVDTLEGKVKEQQRQVDKLRESRGRMESQVENVSTKNVESHQALRYSIGEITQRLNNMELNRGVSYAKVTSPKSVLKSSNVVTVQGVSDVSASTSHARVKELTSEGPTVGPRKLPFIKGKPRDDEHNGVSDKSRAPVQDRNIRSSTKHQDHTSRDVINPETGIKPKMKLQGFVPRDQRPKLGALYVAGIVAGDYDNNDIVDMLREYLISQGKQTKAVRIVKRKGNTAAAKIVMNERDIDMCVQDDMWIDGITCRRWIDDKQ